MLAYDQLQGASGRQRRFRAPRYEAKRLFPNSVPRVRVRSAVYRLHDVSLGGIAALAKETAGELVRQGETVELSILQSGIPIFEAQANVCRLENSVFGSKVAFNLLDRHIDLGKLLTRNAQAQLAVRSSSLAAANAHPLSVDYRAFCADVVRLLRSYGAILDDATKIAREFGSALTDLEILETCEESILQPWRSLWRTGNELVAATDGDRDLLQALKDYTELVVTPELRRGAVWDRSYAKPLGYPGDFGMMNQVYDWQRVGASAYDMLLHRIGLDVAECIKTRMEVVVSHIAEAVRECGQGATPARIASLGSGPAREVQLFLESRTATGARAVFTLIDQEPSALKYASEATYAQVLKSNGTIAVHGLNISFTDILRSTGALAQLPPQQLIYSVGLLDYLSDHRCRALTRRLFEGLAPGGRLIVGNMNQCPMSNHWPMEFAVDWSLHYRGEAEMLAWAQGLEPARAWTETERTGRVRLLFVEKA